MGVGVQCDDVALTFDLVTRSLKSCPSLILKTVRCTQLIHRRDSSVGVHHRCVTFNLGSVKDCSPAIFETFFFYSKDIWIAAD